MPDSGAGEAAHRATPVPRVLCGLFQRRVISTNALIITGNFHIGRSISCSSFRANTGSFEADAPGMGARNFYWFKETSRIWYGALFFRNRAAQSRESSGEVEGIFPPRKRNDCKAGLQREL